VNIYNTLDNELNRMHVLLMYYLSLPREQHINTYSSTSLGSHQMNAPSNPQIPVIYKRISEMQEILLKAISEHDALVQQKVAELAMMGKE
jgi:hypothetical protein